MDDSIHILPSARNSQSFLLFFLVYVYLLFTISTPTVAQQIYKWVDDNGNVHYSDRPDPDAQAEEVFIKPSPDARSNEEPDEAIKRLQATSNELEASRQERETARAKQQEKLRKETELNAKQEKETDKRESQRDRWYYGGFPQRPPTRPPVQPPVNPQPPIAVPLPSNTPAIP
jgi:hypothetical protein